MPSAAAKIEKPASLEGQDSLKSIVTIFEKKTRNLEKRKTRLDHLKKELEQGKELNEDQKAAVGKYDQVQETLELTRELQKSVMAVVQEHLRQSKRQARREQLERQAREAQRVRELLEVQEVLVALGSPAVRQCFLDGEAGAPRLSAETLDQLDQLYRLVCPDREECQAPAAFPAMLAQAAEHLVALLDARPRPLLGTTYKALREVLLQVQQSAYFSGTPAEEDAAAAPAAEDAAAAATVANPGSEEEATATEEDEQQPQQEVPLTPGEDESSPVNDVPEPIAEPLHQQQQSQLPPPPATLPSPLREAEPAPIPVASVVAATTVVPPPLLPGDVIAESAVVAESVSLVSGRLDFFQESQIDLESPHMDPAVVVAALPSVPAAGVPPMVVPQQAAAGFVLAAAPHHHPAVAAPVPPHHSAPQQMVHQQMVPPHQPPQPQLPPMTMDYAEHMPIPTVTFTNQSLRSGGHEGDRRPRRGGGPGGPPRGPRHGGYANGKGSAPQWQSNGSGHDRPEGHRGPPRQAGSGPRGGQHQGRGRPAGNRGPPRNAGVPAAAYAQ